jgi:hypothetical protein
MVERTHDKLSIDEETRKALDEMQSIRAATGVVRIEDRENVEGKSLLR